MKKQPTTKLIAYAEMIQSLHEKIKPIEESLISFIYWHSEKSKALEAINFLDTSLFTSEYAKTVLTALKQTALDGSDLVTTLNNMPNGFDYICRLNEAHLKQDYINLDAKIDEIIKSKNRIMIAEMTQKLNEDLMTEEEMLVEMTSLRTRSRVEKTNEQLANDFFNKNETTSTGFTRLDDITGGIGAGHLWLISGYTSAGKTMFLVSLLHNLIQQNKRCLFFSLEMTNKDIFSRLVAKDSGVNVRRFLSGRQYPEYETNKISVKQSVDKVKALPFTVYQSKRGLEEILVEIRKQANIEHIDCVFIDYAQLISSSNPMRTEYDSMTRVAQKVQDFCKSTNIPVILLSQISNESAKSPDDKMISAKGGGSLPASSDVAIELYSEMTADEISTANATGSFYQVTCRVKKNRHGRTGKVSMSAYAWKSSFEEDAQEFLQKVADNPADWKKHVDN